MKTYVIALLAAGLVAEAATLKTVCGSGCDFSGLQPALDAAEPGWVLELKAGETFNGWAFTLRKKTGSGYITIRSSRAGELGADRRVQPSDAPKLAKVNLNWSGYPLLAAEKGAGYYRFEGIEFTLSPGISTNDLIQLGTVSYGTITDHEVSELPHHLVFDRCYIHGNPGEDGPRRGIMANCGSLTVTNSHISEIKSRNAEGQAIAGWNGMGPFYFRNNYLSASAITTLFGGATPNIHGLRATDLNFLGNHYYRPWKWRSRSGASDPTGACLYDAQGGEYYKNTSATTYWRCDAGAWVQVQQSEFSEGFFNKNQFELKNARRAVVEGNLIENGWLPTWQSQHGAAFLFNQVDNDGSSTFEPSAVIEHVRVANNRIRNTPWGVSVGGIGTYYYPIHEIYVENNLFEEMGKEPQSLGDSLLLQTTREGRFRFAHNTAVFRRATGGTAVGMHAIMSDQMEFYNNILNYQQTGFYDSVTGGGSLWNAIDGCWSLGRALSKNVIVDDQARRDAVYDYPKANLLTRSDTSQLIPCASCAVGNKNGGPWYWENGGDHDVGFVDFQNGNYRLKSTSPYKAWGHMGRDPGADMDAVEWSTAHAADGTHNPYLDFRVRALTPAQASASLRYTAYNTNSCTVTASDRPDFATAAFESDDGGANRDRVLQITGLAPATRYFYRIQCAGFRRDGVFLTVP